MEISRFTEIATSPDKIWPFFVEPEKILKWYSTFKKFEYTSTQHDGIGTTFYIVEKPGGPTIKANFVVTEWEKDKKLAFKMTSGTGVKSYIQKWTLEPIPAGTKFTFLEDFELPFGVIGKLIVRLGKSLSERHIRKMIRTLKQLAVA